MRQRLQLKKIQGLPLYIIMIAKGEEQTVKGQLRVLQPTRKIKANQAAAMILMHLMIYYGTLAVNTIMLAK